MKAPAVVLLLLSFIALACASASLFTREEHDDQLQTALTVMELATRDLHELVLREEQSISRHERATGCSSNGVDGGTCTATSSLTSLSFCGTVLSTYTTKNACVLSSGASTIDKKAYEVYTTYLPTLFNTAACQNAYRELLCSINFNQCADGLSTGLCASTCSNYLLWCGNNKTTCTANTLPGVVTVPNSVGPSATCTGAASSLLPPFFAITLSVAAVFFVQKMQK